MRDILFRAQQTDGKVWIQGRNIFIVKEPAGAFIMQSGSECAWIHTNNGKGVVSGVWSSVIPDTVGQYTGLTDKNGKKIFEGDIVSRKLPNKEYRYLVGFSNGEFELQLNGRPELNLFIAHLTESELIGNIHDNPELLEVVE